ncbi:MAG: YqhA family protein [Chloroflexota bacterium]
MSKLLEKSRYLAIIGVLGLLVAALASFGWGIIQTIHAVKLIVESQGTDISITVAIIEIVDIFLIATTLLIFSVNLYELFIADIDVPEWMVSHDLYELKTKLSSMIILVMAVKFIEKMVDVKNYMELLQYGTSIALVSGILIAFGFFGHKN